MGFSNRCGLALDHTHCPINVVRGRHMTAGIDASVVATVNPQTRYMSQDILVNSTGQSSLNRSYRDVNRPIHVEPAAKLQLSLQALEYLQRSQ